MNYSRIRFVSKVLPLVLTILFTTTTLSLSADNIVDLEISNDLSGMTVTSDNAISSYNAFQLENPYRLVIDIPGVKEQLSKKIFSFQSPLIDEIKVGQHPEKVRLVIYFKDILPTYNIEKDNNKLLVFWNMPPVDEKEEKVVAETIPVKEKVELVFSRGMLSFNQENYEEALPAFTKAANLKPDQPEIQYFLGLTHMQLENNEEALNAFQKVTSLDPAYPKVHYDMGVTYYRLGNYTKALENFETAERQEPNRAMIYYFKGHIFYLQDKFSESLSLLAKAGQLDPELKQTTHFFRGLALLKLKRYDESEQEFTYSLNLDPRSELGEAAGTYLDLLKEKKVFIPKKWRLNAGVSYQYDDNVVLESDSSATRVSGESDSRAVMFVDGEYRFIQNLPFTMGVRYNFYQSIHSRLHDFDLQNHQGTLFGNYQGKWKNIPYQFQLDYQYGNALLNEKRYREAHSVTAMLNLQVSSNLLTQLKYRFQDKDYHYSITNHTANRDGINNLIAITQYVYFLDNEGFFKVGFAYDNDSTNGSNWDYDGYKVLAGVRVPLLWQTTFDANFYYYQMEYDNNDFYFNHSRRDEEYMYAFSLHRNIFKHCDAIIGYTRVDNGSNINFYDYDRNIFSFTISLWF